MVVSDAIVGGGARTKSPPTQLLNELITKLKNSRDYKSSLKNFKEFIDKKDLGSQSLRYFLYYDLDAFGFRIASEIEIPYNSLVMAKCLMPSKKDKNVEKKVIEAYKYES